MNNILITSAGKRVSLVKAFKKELIKYFPTAKVFVVDSNISTAKFNTFTIQLCRSENVAVLANESFGLDNFTLYPNPNNGNFNIQFNSNSGNEIKINVHDIRGREIYSKSYTNNGLFNENLQLSNVQSGVYLVTVQDGSRKEVKKIVIQ